MKNVQTNKKEERKGWDWTGAILLLLAVVMASWRLVATGWTEGLFRLQLLALLATVFGLALGASRFRRGIAVAFGVAYGAFFLPWQLGLTILEDLAWSERLILLWERLVSALGLWAQKEDMSDPILFLVQTSLLLWWLGSWAGFSLSRHRNAWLAGLPMGGMLVIFQTYDSVVESRIWYLAAYMFFLLLLVARVHLLKQQDEWRRTGTQQPTYVGQDMLRATLLAASLLVLLAWVTPVLAAADNPAQAAWEAITAPWRKLRDEFGGAYSSLKGDTYVVSDYYGETLSLGTGNALADTIVLTVEVLDEGAAPPRYYWRDRIYDDYADGRWKITFEQEQRLRAEENALLLPDYEGRTLGEFRMTTGRSIYLLHSPTQPVSVNRTADVDYALNPDGSWDIAALLAPISLRPRESYAVEAHLTTATVTQLRAAGTDYPDWVLERYLTVPDEITTRTLELAQSLAEGQDSAYDVATAITAWLRENIEYQESVQAAPSSFEPIDWMLFENKQAFCNYYATAEVIMLRSLGIPARMAVGYAQGELNERNLLEDGAEVEKNDLLEGIVNAFNYYTVRQRDAHAWPEVFFPGIGWVEFEPTANQAVLVRPVGGDPNESELAAEENAAEFQELGISEAENSILEARLAEEQAAAAAAATGRRLRGFALLGSAVGVLGAALFWRRKRQAGGSSIPLLLERGLRRLDLQPPKPVRNWAHYAELPELPQAYMEINAALRRLGAPPLEGDTPEERAAALKAQLPKLGPVVDEVSALYQRGRYGLGSDIDIADGAQRAKWAIRLASWIEMLNRWGRRLERRLRGLAPGTRRL
ncbi:MAG: hypothetical protein DWG76_07120 [Chloroflexi bacterium]|nr:hypothetical protein [Chloroflexota bacterium]